MTDVQGIYIITAPMPTRLPDAIDPWKLSAAGGRLQGELALSRMPRLRPLLNCAQGQAAVVLEAGVEQDLRFIAGRVEVCVELICQRCFGPLILPLEAEFRLALLQTESQAVHLPKEYDPLVAPEDSVNLVETIEDELLLALPLVPLHADNRQCEANGFVSPKAAVAQETNPFAVLSTLLNESKTRSH